VSPALQVVNDSMRLCGCSGEDVGCSQVGPDTAQGEGPLLLRLKNDLELSATLVDSALTLLLVA
jgi:hypothetical protein